MGKKHVLRNWKEAFSAKVMSAEDAVKRIRNGNRVFVSGNASVPRTVVEALMDRRDLEDIQIVHLLAFGGTPYVEQEFCQRFRHNALFIGATAREAINDGRADYTPIHLSDVGRLFRTGRMRLDVAIVQVSPPDEHGYCSFGMSTDVVKAAAESARVVIAEVNARTPRTLGDCFIHMSNIDAAVSASYPLPEIRQEAPGDEARQIARHVTELIDDGATLQLGIGAIPNAVMEFVTTRKDLGVHTEMFSDGIIPLVRDGVINNARKSLHRLKIVASFAFGSQALYDFVDNNPLIEFRSAEYVNDPFVIAKNDRMCAINSAIEVDLTGQVCAESIGTSFFSGFGGQVDFIRGAARAKDGKPIIALPSTARGGAVSRIVPQLKDGAGVVTTRADVHYVVTEYGIAYLHGKNVRQRAMALIEVAHPKFRPWLLSEAKARSLVYRDQIEPHFEMPVYPAELERHETLREGHEVLIRPARATDEPLMREAFYSLSERAIYQRFFQPLKSMPHARLQEFLRVDYKNDMVLVATDGSGSESSIVAVARYNRLRERDLAEVAFVIRDEWQNLGLGTRMFGYLVELGRSNGLRGFVSEVMAENHGMLRVFHKGGVQVQSRLENGIYHLLMEFPPT